MKNTKAEIRLKPLEPDKDNASHHVPKKDNKINNSIKVISKIINKKIPNNANFIPKAANETLSKNEPSTCASGNQIENGYVGVL